MTSIMNQNVYNYEENTELPPLKSLLNSIPLPNEFINEYMTEKKTKLPILIPPLSEPFYSAYPVQSNNQGRQSSSNIQHPIQSPIQYHIRSPIQNINHIQRRATSQSPTREHEGQEQGEGESDREPGQIHQIKGSFNRISPKHFVCDECGKSFTTADHLSRHNKSVHMNIKNFKCPYSECNLFFARKDNCMQHYKTHEGVMGSGSNTLSNNTSVNNEDNSGNESTSNLGENTSNILRKYKCKTCDKLFVTSGHLSRHSRIHTGEKNHECWFPNCHAKFSRKDNCMQHYKTHMNTGKQRRRRRSKRSEDGDH